MNDSKEIRWRQRFKNFKKAFFQLLQAVERINELDDLAKEGLIQRFEYTFELSWKTMKDYLEAQGIIAKFPREVIKQAFANEIITNGEIWMSMLNDRNLLTHTYDEEIFRTAVNNIVNRYFPEIKQLYNYLSNEYNKNT